GGGAGRPGGARGGGGGGGGGHRGGPPPPRGGAPGGGGAVRPPRASGVRPDGGALRGPDPGRSARRDAARLLRGRARRPGDHGSRPRELPPRDLGTTRSPRVVVLAGAAAHRMALRGSARESYTRGAISSSGVEIPLGEIDAPARHARCLSDQTRRMWGEGGSKNDLSTRRLRLRSRSATAPALSSGGGRWGQQRGRSIPDPHARAGRRALAVLAGDPVDPFGCLGPPRRRSRCTAARRSLKLSGRRARRRCLLQMVGRPKPLCPKACGHSPPRIDSPGEPWVFSATQPHAWPAIYADCA